MAEIRPSAAHVATYIASMGLTSIDAAPDILFSKPDHAALVREALSSQPAISRDDVINAAALVGAPWQTTDQVTAAAEVAVGKLIADIEAMRQAGALKKLNADYKTYRQGQIAKAEKAMPYSAFLSNFTTSLIRLAAEQFTPR